MSVKNLRKYLQEDIQILSHITNHYHDIWLSLQTQSGGDNEKTLNSTMHSLEEETQNLKRRLDEWKKYFNKWHLHKTYSFYTHLYQIFKSENENEKKEWKELVDQHQKLSFEISYYIQLIQIKQKFYLSISEEANVSQYTSYRHGNKIKMNPIWINMEV